MTAIENTTDSFIGTQAVTTSYYGIGGDASLVQSVHFKWDATLVATITIWNANFPEVALNSVIDGDWVQQNPTAGYTPISPPSAATATAPLTLIIAGGTAGGAIMDVGNTGSRRGRCRVVCATGGFLRIRPNGKP